MKKRTIRFIIRYIIGYISLFIFSVFFALYLTKKQENEINKIKNVEKISEFPNDKLKNQFKKLINYNTFKNKVVLIDFWFAGCEPCRKEMKHFPNLLKTYKEKLVILSYSIDDKKTTDFLLKEKPMPFNFLDDKNSNWHFLNTDFLDKNSFVNKLNIKSFPSYYIIDQDKNYIDNPFNSIVAIHFIFDKYLNGLKYFVNKSEGNDKKFWLEIFVLHNLIIILILLFQFLIFLIRKYFLKHQKIKF